MCSYPFYSPFPLIGVLGLSEILLINLLHANVSKAQMVDPRGTVSSTGLVIGYLVLLEIAQHSWALLCSFGVCCLRPTLAKVVIVSPVSLLILVIWKFSLCLLDSLDEGFSIWMIFLKNQLFISLILCVVFFFIVC